MPSHKKRKARNPAAEAAQLVYEVALDAGMTPRQAGGAAWFCLTGPRNVGEFDHCKGIFGVTVGGAIIDVGGRP